MRAALLALVLLACGGGTAAREETSTSPTTTRATPSDVPESLACTTDDDCVLLPGVCGGVEPTNRAHEDATRESIRQRQSVASCMAPTTPEPVRVARCNAGQCMAIEPP